MRQTLSLLLAAVVLLATASIGWAEDAQTDKKADGATLDGPTFVELRVQMHRTLAALIEARATDTTDEAKIEKLSDKLQAIRKQMWADGAAQGWRPGPRGPWSAQQCPMGGPRMGRGPGMGGPGSGNWQGRGYGRGQGGPGQCYRGRCGAGRGMGPGMGRGMGSGMGRGMGPGMGRGMGPGMGRGMGPGMGRGMGSGMGRGMGYGAG